MTDDAEVVYHISERFDPKASRGVRWDDPAIGVRWPEAENQLNRIRDRLLPL